MSAWLVAGLVHGTLFVGAAWLLAATVLRNAHPATRALLFFLALLKFVVPFGPSFVLSASDTAPIVGRVLITAERGEVLSRVQWLVPTWLGLAGLLAAVRVVRHLRNRHALLRATPPPPALLARVTELSRHFGVRVPDTRLDARGPCLVGIWRPTLLLPPDVTGAELDAMIGHELAHVRRFDAPLRLFQAIVETLFFFWPPVRFAARQLELAREQACDLAVVEAGVITSPGYAELLLRLGQPTSPALAMSARPSHLERRITMVLQLPAQPPRRRWMSLVVLVAASLAVSGASLAAPPRAPAPSPLKIDGALDSRMVQTVIVANLHQVTACYRDYLASHPATGGRLVLHWGVKDDGSVEETCQSSGTTIPAELGRCVSNRVATWGFPSPGFGQRAEVEYTFEFSPAHGG